MNEAMSFLYIQLYFDQLGLIPIFLKKKPQSFSLHSLMGKWKGSPIYVRLIRRFGKNVC